MADHDAVMGYMGGIADVEIFTLSFVQTKNLQRGAGITGINGLHVGSLHENLVQLFAANIFDPSAQGNGNLSLRGREVVAMDEVKKKSCPPAR